MAGTWKNDGTFHLGINMAGAVSAGAYTAGVLDFLTEALEEWYAAKAAPNSPVPIKGTTNRFYESWVNKIDIEYLLGTDDLLGGQVISLLDSTIIDAIAEYALTPLSDPKRPPYLSTSLTLFLTLTNVRGVPFSLNGTAEGSAEEDIGYYADRLQFETVQGAATPTSSSAQPLPIGSNAGAWPLLKDAARATGAFPIFLAPRKIDRRAGDYFYSPWESTAGEEGALVQPHWDLKESDSFTTLNIDGGVTDKDPFELACAAGSPDR